MIDWLINKLFWWTPVREAIFAEVNFYNSITRTMNDPESMKIVSSFWDEEDGWRGWAIKDDGTYYFHDTPEKTLGEVMDILSETEVGV
jgi:hypothetical protein